MYNKYCETKDIRYSVSCIYRCAGEHNRDPALSVRGTKREPDIVHRISSGSAQQSVSVRISLFRKHPLVYAARLLSGVLPETEGEPCGDLRVSVFDVD